MPEDDHAEADDEELACAELAALDGEELADVC